MQVNSWIQGMLNVGVPSAGQPGQGGSLEEAAQPFEEMLSEQAQQNREAKPAPKKDAAQAEKKPQQPAQKEEKVPEEKGAEVAAGLVVNQPVVLFDVVAPEEVQPMMQAAAPVVAVAEQAPVVQEILTPVEERTAEPGVQVVETAPVETGFQEEMQQIPTVEEQPETQDVQVEVKPQEAKAEAAHSEEALVVEEEKPENVPAEDVEVEAKPVFHEEVRTPVKVGESYEPVAPEEPEAPQQLADRLMQMMSQGDTRVEIALSPENLGPMTIEITRLQDGALHVVLGAVSQKATTLLQQNSANLHSLLAANQEGEVRIEVQQQEPQQPMEQFLNPDEQGKQQPQQQHKPQKQAETEDFIGQLRLGLVEQEDE